MFKEKLVRFILGVIIYGVLMLVILFLFDWDYPNKYTFTIIYAILMSLAELFISKPLSNLIQKLFKIKNPKEK